MVVIGGCVVLMGLFLTALGFVLPDRVRPPLEGVSALLAPLGLAAALIGVLLVCVPDFFSKTPVTARPDDVVRPESGDAP